MDMRMVFHVGRRWQGHRTYRGCGIAWAIGLLALVFAGQFGKSGDLDRIFFTLFWVASFAVVFVAWLVHAAIRNPWVGCARALGEAASIVVATILLAATIVFTCKKLGIGNWPPRDGVFAAQFRDKKAA